MVKAIFFDIDGTLVSFKTHTIPESTRKALAQLREKGIKVFISTGRPKVLMMKAVGDLEFDGYITLNGAYCFTADHRDIYKGGIPEDDVERLIRFNKQHPEIPFVCVHDDTWFITGVNESVQRVADLIEIDVPPVRPMEEARGKEILQIMGYFETGEDEEVFADVLKLVFNAEGAGDEPRLYMESFRQIPGEIGLKIGELAEVCYLSESHFRKLFLCDTL